jgi:hypothetical protein
VHSAHLRLDSRGRDGIRQIGTRAPRLDYGLEKHHTALPAGHEVPALAALERFCWLGGLMLRMAHQSFELLQDKHTHRIFAMAIIRSAMRPRFRFHHRSACVQGGRGHVFHQR